MSKWEQYRKPQEGVSPERQQSREAIATAAAAVDMTPEALLMQYARAAASPIASALDLTRQAMARPLGQVRDALASALARIEMVRDTAGLDTREYYDAKAVAEDVKRAAGGFDDAVAVLHGASGRTAAEKSLYTPAAGRPVDVGAAAGPPKGYTPPAPQPAPTTHAPGPRTRRDCADAGCPVCKATIAADPTAAADQLGAGAVAADLLAALFGVRRAPAANGVAVTDRAG